MLGTEEQVVWTDQRASLVIRFRSMWSKHQHRSRFFSLPAVSGRKEETRDEKRNFHF